MRARLALSERDRRVLDVLPALALGVGALIAAFTSADIDGARWLNALVLAALLSGLLERRSRLLLCVAVICADALVLLAFLTPPPEFAFASRWPPWC